MSSPSETVALDSPKPRLALQGLTKEELAELLYPLSEVKPRDLHELTEENIEKKKRKTALLRARQIFQWAYVRHVTNFDEMTDLSKAVREWLNTHLEIFRLNERVSQQALDGTYKFLWNLGDNKTIESVIIPAALKEKKDPFAADFDDSEMDEVPSSVMTGSLEGMNGMQPSAMMPGLGATVAPTPSEFAGRQSNADLKSSSWARLTACISSQVGCAMACKFCLTGIQGLDRHLKTHEIVTQVHELRMRAPITNIVFMGMGEPLHNLESVIKACKILLDQDGLNFSKRKVTVSTSGLVPGIEALGANVDVSLAISLNASTDEQRSEIMPVNKKWNLASLMGTLRKYPLGPHRRITFEYVMLKDFNDSLEDAARVIQLVRGIPSKINLIPFNEHSGSMFKRPSDERVRQFQKYLLDRHLTTTVRISRGRDISAACGQLRSLFGTARGTEKHKDFVPPVQAGA